MATKLDNQEIKRRAIEKLAASRLGLHAGVSDLKRNLSPVQVSKRIFNDHKAWVITAGVLAVALPVLLLFRSRGPVQGVRHSSIVSAVEKAPAKSLLGTILIGALGMIARAVLPRIINSSIVPRVLGSLGRETSPLSSHRPVKPQPLSPP